MFGRRLPWQSPLEARAGEHIVTSEGTLLEAIEFFRVHGTRGGTIRLTGVIEVKNTIVVPSTVVGIYIRGPAMVTMKTATIFRLLGTEQVIEDVQFENATGFIASTLCKLEATRCEFRNNRNITGAVLGPAVHVTAGICRVTGNLLRTDTNVDGVRVSSGTRTAVIGNDLGGVGNITTNASSGSNVVAANTGTNILTTHASDAVGLNT